jgi:tetratricopeptide (TPR) repeat protein
MIQPFAYHRPMRRDSVAFALSGTLFGLLVGWMLGSQQTPPVAQVTPPATPPAQTSAAPTPVDAQRAAQLEQQANAQPADAAVRTTLANLYFDAKHYDQAARWYEASLALNPRDADVSTDLAICYYYADDVDKALAQLDASLKVDARHVKTLLNQGFIRAFGKNDLVGAGASWEKVVAISPDSEEGKRAKQGLEGLKAAHQNNGGTAAPGGKG